MRAYAKHDNKVERRSYIENNIEDASVRQTFNWPNILNKTKLH